jgi:hypothetical protein
MFKFAFFQMNIISPSCDLVNAANFVLSKGFYR